MCWLGWCHIVLEAYLKFEQSLQGKAITRFEKIKLWNDLLMAFPYLGRHYRKCRARSRFKWRLKWTSAPWVPDQFRLTRPESSKVRVSASRRSGSIRDQHSDSLSRWLRAWTGKWVGRQLTCDAGQPIKVCCINVSATDGLEFELCWLTKEKSTMSFNATIIVAWKD